MDQSARTAALDQFRKGEVTLLIASDVAARGLDIPAVSHVFNFDVPHHADDYVHRIGRTGRAGSTGTAITVVAPADQKSVAAIEKLIGQTIPWMDGAPPRRPHPRRRGAAATHRDGRSRSRGRAAPANTANRAPSRHSGKEARQARACPRGHARRPAAIKPAPTMVRFATCRP